MPSIRWGIEPTSCVRQRKDVMRGRRRIWGLSVRVLDRDPRTTFRRWWRWYVIFLHSQDSVGPDHRQKENEYVEGARILVVLRAMSQKNVESALASDKCLNNSLCSEGVDVTISRRWNVLCHLFTLAHCRLLESTESPFSVRTWRDNDNHNQGYRQMKI
jgi:hypothetical protein